MSDSSDDDPLPGPSNAKVPTKRPRRVRDAKRSPASVGNQSSSSLPSQPVNYEALDNALRLAINKLQSHRMKDFIKIGAGMSNSVAMKGETPLTMACRINPPPARRVALSATLKSLIDAGVDVNKKNSRGQTPLHVANTPTAVDILLTNGASVHLLDARRNTPLFIACKYKRCHAIIKAMLKANAAEVPLGLQPVRSPLHVASKSTLSLLLRKGFSANGLGGADEPPLFTMCRKTVCPDDTIRLLLDYGATIDIRDTLQRTPLHIACQTGVFGTVKILLENGAGVNIVDRFLETPLFFAARKKDITDDIINELVRNGADVNKKNDRGRTPLHVSCFSATVLILHGAHVDERDNYGETPLFKTCKGVSLDKLELDLIEHAASVKMKNNEGNTVLHLACFNLRSDLVKLFLGHGASINEPNRMCETPLFNALRNLDCSESFIVMLMKEYADIDKRNKNGCSPINVALMKKHYWAVVLFLENGASLNGLETRPLAMAHSSIFPFMLDYGVEHCDYDFDRGFCSYSNCLFASHHLAIGNYVKKMRLLSSEGGSGGFSPMDAEIACMKTVPISPTKWTYHHLYFNKIPSDNIKDIVNHVISSRVKLLFPYYGSVIFAKFLQIKKAFMLRESAGFFSLIPDKPRIPPEIAIIILSHLNHWDLATVFAMLYPDERRLH